MPSAPLRSVAFPIFSAVRGLPDLLGDRGHEGGEFLVIRAGRGDDAVAVELRVGEDLRHVRRVLEGDGILLELEVREDLLRRGEQLCAFRILLVEGGEGDFGAAGEEQVVVLEDRGEPLGGRDDLVHADVPVVVHVDELEGFLVEFQVLGRAAEDGPQLAVQLAQVGDVGPGGDFHPDGPADRGEGPVVLVHYQCVLVFPIKQNSQKKMKGTKSFAIDGKIRIFAVQFYEMADELQKRQARCPSAYGPKL